MPRVLIALLITAAAVRALAQPQLEERRASPRSLVISVRFDEAGQASQRDLGASGRISNRGAEVELRAQEARSAREEGIVQRVMVLDDQVVEMARRAKPLVPIPPSLRGREFTVPLTVIFNLTDGG